MRYRILIFTLLVCSLAEGQMITSGAVLRTDTSGGTSTLTARRSNSMLLSFRNGFRITIPQDSVYFPDYRGKDKDVADTIAVFESGYLYQKSKSSITWPFTQITGTASVNQLPTIPYSKLSGTPTIPSTYPFTSITGQASLSQLPTIPYSQLSGTPTIPTGFPFTAITGVATVAQLPAIPFTKVTSGRTSTMVTRPLETAFIPNATRDVFAGYTISISASMSLMGGQIGTVFLEISPNNTTWTEMARIVNQNTGALAVGLALSNIQVGQIAAVVPAGYYVRLRSAGTATIAYISGTETAL